MLFDDVAHQGQAHAQAAVGARERAVTLAEAIEDPRQQLRANANTGVGDGQP